MAAGSAAGTPAPGHEIWRGIGKDFDERVGIAFEELREDVHLVLVAVPVVLVDRDAVVVERERAVCATDRLRESGHVRVGPRDVAVRGIVAAADVVAHDVELQPLRLVEKRVHGEVRERVAVADAVRPPAERGAPALEHAVVERRSFGRVEHDGRGRAAAGLGGEDRAEHGCGEDEDAADGGKRGKMMPKEQDCLT